MLIARTVAQTQFHPVTEVVCGGARGADTWGALWAHSQSIPVKMFPADWSRYGKGAGAMRNKQMALYTDAAIVFLYQNSRGSANMIAQMQAQSAGGMASGLGSLIGML